MADEFNFLNEEESLKAENEFLKMKMMLEQGAGFGGMSDKDLPPEIENEFLRNIMTFEKQFAEERKIIKLFDKIDRPQHFKPVNEIDDNAIDKAWDELRDYLNKHGIDLDACSPNISKKELYRFTTEELFEHEMDDMNLPGWTTNFIYDEFYPDLVYDNSKLVEQNLLRDIFSKNDLFYEIDYDNENFLFNGRSYESLEPFIEMINRFKSLFDELELTECTVMNCEVKEKKCVVTGVYKAFAKTGKVEMFFTGDFTVELILNDLDYWNFKIIQIAGFNPE
ncbi:MAG TPA: hypothetical protein VKB95_13255 [Chitinophagaceae bacterium]|nr:hypothetical protein [Chitinophagaceae bacterium]